MRWLQYFSVAEENHRGVIHNYEGELWTLAAILFVHAVIAYTDALTIKAGGVKGSGDNHLQVVDLIRQVISLDRNDTIALNRLIKILSEKSKVAYSGKVYSQKQVDLMMKNYTLYRSWIIDKIESIT